MALSVEDSKSEYLLRYIDAELDELSAAPAIAIDGAKGVGKTETSVRCVDVVYR